MTTIERKLLTSTNKRGQARGSSSSILAAINVRYVSLVCLTLQTTSIIITYSYSRQIPKGSTRYLSSTVVVIAEILKLLFCTAVIFKDSNYNVARLLSTLNREIFNNLGESLKVLVPASLYALQNNLAFYALTNLDPATYQVAYQLKILTTALFSVFVVHKRIRRRQWFALFLLFVGVSLVQMPQDKDSASSSSDTSLESKNRFLGLLAVVACCMSSGFSGVYFERLIKFNPHQSLWIRNFQLAMFCLLISIGAMLYQDFSSIMTDGMLQGYSTLTWTVVFLQAFGGLIVAAVVKHADNVLKGFATSISIILSTLLSFLLFDNFNPATNFYYGATIVIVSTIMYSL
uniref:UDP-N-acetylglucosamine transporter n=1 Tax=Aceria tosichella TaxID=561515 RepID=A0A6G1S8L8_9ACAR